MGWCWPEPTPLRQAWTIAVEHGLVVQAALARLQLDGLGEAPVEHLPAALASFRRDQRRALARQAAAELRARHIPVPRQPRILVGLYLSTEELTAGCVELLPGQRSDTHVHGGDQAGYVLEGRLNLALPDHAGPGPGNGWCEMQRDDGFFVPAGTPPRYYNMTDEKVQFMFGVAPTYLTGGA